MSEFIGLALVETDNGEEICETPRFSALKEGTEVYVEGFARSGKVRGKVLAYSDINKNGEPYAFISKLGMGCGSDGSYRRILSTIRECPMEWEE